MSNMFSVRQHSFMAKFLAVLILPMAMMLSLACGGGSTSTGHSGVKGSVVNKIGQGLSGANVYLVPVTSIDQTKITQANVLSGATTDYDEPLEDAVRLKGSTFLRATTGSDGSYHISASIPTGSYYLYVEPAITDTAHLPGGSRCRIAMDAKNLNGEVVSIEMSGNTPTAATYIGSSECLKCHESTHGGTKYTAHSLGISDPKDTSAANLAYRKNFPNFAVGTSATIFKTAATYIGGTKLHFGKAAGSSEFEVKEFSTSFSTASGVVTQTGNIYLWKNNASGNFMITLENALNPSDNRLDLNVKLTYGGTLYKQNYLVDVPSTLTSGVVRKGLYPLLQFQAFPGISYGNEGNYNTTMNRWRDLNLDDWWNSATSTFKAPAVTETFEAQCASCHYTDYKNLLPDATTSEWLVDAPKEVNIGCESCHGPGSEHKASGKGDGIVALQKLSPSRENMVCGRCHEAATGKGTGVYAGVLFNSGNVMPAPGISRSKFIAEHTSVASANLDTLWGDKIHSKGNHQQYTDFLKSKHYHNTRQLLACSDCHDVHADSTLKGATEYVHNLKGDPANPVGELCMKCHAMEYTEHMDKYTNAQHMGLDTKCSDCHMPKTAKAGAGTYGIQTTNIYLTGVASSGNTYLTGDISSHVFDVIKKTSTGVSGATPELAMPAPYTNKCGACHYVDNLKNRSPSSLNKGVTE
jgi:hypothetical protein